MYNISNLKKFLHLKLMINKEKIVEGIYLIKNFMNSKDILEKIKNECVMDSFTINGKILCRTGCFEGDQDNIPWIRCPSIENQIIHPWSSPLFEIKNKIENELGYKTNIAKLQKYDDGRSFIHNHSDKIIDLDNNTPIFIIRFGATRICKLIHKTSKQIKLVNVTDNSLLIISYNANLEWTHGILEEPDITEPSYSIVYRNSITFKSGNYVYGENTPFKTENDINDKALEDLWCHDTFKKKIVKAYAYENNNICDITLYSDIINNSAYTF